MFYSHEILTSQKHGVATVWVLATLGESFVNRKLSRKAIQEVNVPKACVTIDEPPGAPIALRLQASLLYGVSKVYSQQCQYVLGDAEKFRVTVQGMFRVLESSTLDPKAGKANRKQLLVPDDPDFHISNFFSLPPLDTVNGINHPDYLFGAHNSYSQLSPFNSQNMSTSSGRNSMALDFGNASFGENFGPDPFGGGGSSARKPQVEIGVFAENDLLPDIGDFDLGFTVDADGNIHENPEPELPELPIAAPSPPRDFDQQHKRHGSVPPLDEHEVILHDEDAPLPDAEPLPARELQPFPERTPPQTDEAGTAAVQRRARRRKNLASDRETQVSRSELRDWNQNYLQMMEDERARIRKRRELVTKEQAAKNAYEIMFGRGIGGVGQDLGIPGFRHELAALFSGEGLQVSALGRVVSECPENRRRPASRAFRDDADSPSPQGRRVRPRLDDGGGEDGRGLSRAAQGQEDETTALGADDLDLLPEVGREPGHPLSDQPAAPWHRHSSILHHHGSSVRGSSAKGPGGHGPRQVQESPLQHRGSALPDLVRLDDDDYDDNDLGPYGDGGSGEHHHHRPSSPARPGFGLAADAESRDFLSFLQHEALERGRPRGAGDERWVVLSQVLPPPSTGRAVAAAAFYHVLCLATARALRVRQDGRRAPNLFPFGDISVAVALPAPAPAPGPAEGGRSPEMAVTELL